MSFNTGIFYVDYVNGSDTARSGLTTCTFADNGSGVCRVTKVGHGLITGAVVSVPSGAMAGYWLINKIDDDNFDLFTNRAVGTITVTGTPVADETFVIASQTFTFKASRSGAGEVTISADTIQQCKNIALAINTDIDTAQKAQFDEYTSTVKVYNIVSGTAGNSTVFTESATGIAVSGSGTLAGGANSTYAASTSKTITPFGGSSWADAWKKVNGTTTYGAALTANCLVLGAKSADPASVGNATWTNVSKTITLDAAQTLTVDMCDSAWTGANGVTPATNTSRKEGTNCNRFLMPGSPATGTLYGYKTIADTNFSAYQKLSFWISSDYAIATGHFKLCLCSDTAGTTIVDTFQITALASYGIANGFYAQTLARVGGGNLGTSIQSIALYSDTVAPTAAKTIALDNIIACTSAGLCLNSLISKNTLAQGGTETWYGIQSINGVTVLLDNDFGSTLATAGRGYYGSTENVPTYQRIPITTVYAGSSSTVVQELVNSGTTAGYVEYQGGYNISTGVQDGETWFLGNSGYGLQLSSKSYNKVNHYNFVGYYYGIYLTGSHHNLFVNSSANNCNNYNYYITTSYLNTFNTIIGACNGLGNGVKLTNTYLNTFNTIYNCHNNLGAQGGFYIYYDAMTNTTTMGNIVGTLYASNNNNDGVYFHNSNNNRINNLIANYNSAYAVASILGHNNKIFEGSCANNTTGGMYLVYNTILYLYNFTISEANEVAFSTYDYYSKLYSTRHDNTDDNDTVFQNGGYALKQASVRNTASGFAWQIHIASSARTTEIPYDLKFCVVPFVANKLVTVTAYVKKDHATNVGCRLKLKAYEAYGENSDKTTPATDTTDWQQLTLTFTPTKAGACELWFEGWYVAGNSDVYIDDVTITQAA